ncbi:MAG: methylenetetrahydrofolate reductase [Pseudomonadota bacterium]
MTANGEHKKFIVDFLTGFTAETTPGSAAKIPDFREHLREGTIVYITFLPGSNFDDTIAVARRLKDEGFKPVPHFAARSIPNQQFFENNLKTLVEEVGIDQVLCIAGAVEKPVGDFTDSTQLLDTGLFDKYGIKKIGLAGHPEGSPDMSDEAIMSALQWKNSFAKKTDAELYLVTQFCFEAEPIIAWDKMLQSEGNKLPIHIGIPGLATLKSLLAHAKACGIGNSMKVLTKQAKNITKLLVVQEPDKLVADLAEYKAMDPECGIAGVHMYPLGGLRRSAQWSYAVTDGMFTMKDSGKGFKIEVDID